MNASYHPPRDGQCMAVHNGTVAYHHEGCSGWYGRSGRTHGPPRTCSRKWGCQCCGADVHQRDKAHNAVPQGAMAHEIMEKGHRVVAVRPRMCVATRWFSFPHIAPCGWATQSITTSTTISTCTSPPSVHQGGPSSCGQTHAALSPRRRASERTRPALLLHVPGH